MKRKLSAIEHSALTILSPSLKEVTSIESMNWENLKAYRLTSHPNELVVITNADKDQFKAALDRFHQGNDNIEQVLRDDGFVAVAGTYEGEFKA